jgi:POT family proton-dependent oligopeptide transporter
LWEHALTVAESPASPGNASREDGPATRHPQALKYVIGAAFCESFAYWGVLSVLVLYMRDKLLAQGDTHRIFGLQPIIDLMGTGPVATGSIASAIVGVFTGLIWLAPIFGGLIADRWLGRTRTIALGAAAMTLGHLLLSFDFTFMIALLSLLIGLGFFKANITSQVGELYELDDPKRESAFSLLLLCTNLSGIVAPLICGALAQYLGWHWAFGASASVMLVGLLSYLAGRRLLIAATSVAVARERKKLSRTELRNVLLLALLLAPLSVTQLSNFQLFNAYQVWAQQHYDLRLFGHAIPAAWLLSFDNGLVVVMIAAVARFWPWWNRRHQQVDDLTKIAFATVLSAGAPLALAGLSAMSNLSGHPIPLYWAFSFHLLNDLGFAIMVPAGWSLYTRVAPSLTGFLIGLYSVHLFLTNLLVAWLGGLYDGMDAVTFWLIHAGLMGAGAAMLFFIRLGIVMHGRPAANIDAAAVAPQGA